MFRDPGDDACVGGVVPVGVYRDVGRVAVLGVLVQVVHDVLVFVFDEVHEAVVASTGERGFLVLVFLEGLPDSDHGANGGCCGGSRRPVLVQGDSGFPYCGGGDEGWGEGGGDGVGDGGADGHGDDDDGGDDVVEGKEEEVDGGGGVGGDAKAEAKAKQLEWDPDGPWQECQEAEHIFSCRCGTSEGNKDRGQSVW